jgi:hypothetical protein
MPCLSHDGEHQHAKMMDAVSMQRSLQQTVSSGVLSWLTEVSAVDHAAGAAWPRVGVLCAGIRCAGGSWKGGWEDALLCSE